MGINKNYLKGAKDIGGIAEKGFNRVADDIREVKSVLHHNADEQNNINNAVFDILDDKELRLVIQEIGYKPIDMKSIFNLSPSNKTILCSIFMNIDCNGECRDYIMALCARLGVLAPTDAINIKELDGDLAEVCAQFLYKIIALSDYEDNVISAVTKELNRLKISQNTLMRIESQVRQLKDKFDDKFYLFLLSEIESPDKFIRKPIKKERIHRRIKALVVGKTGSGKSTLINAIFDQENAVVGCGKPVTTKSCLYSDDSEMIQIYDTIGIGLNESEQSIAVNEIVTLIEDNNIDVLLYCVNSHSNRFEKFEADLISKLKNTFHQLSVFVLLTCSTNSTTVNELTEYIKSQTNRSTVHAILASDYETDAGIVSAYGLEELVEEITNA